MSVDSPAGVIHDIGYHRYTGPRLGRGYARATLYLHSVRTAFGIGRGAKAKVFPWLVVGLAFIIAIVAIVVRALSGEVFITYLRFTDDVEVPALLFLAIAAPELVSRDLRSHVLPLYFSRPLGRSDYALAKLAAAISAMWLVFAAPMLAMYLGGAFSLPLGKQWHEVTDLLGGLGYAAIAAVVYASLAVFVASLASRRAVAAAAIVACFVITAPVVAVLEALGRRRVQDIAPILNPVGLVEGLKAWMYHPDGMRLSNGYGLLYLAVAVVLVASCVLALLARYRKVAA